MDFRKVLILIYLQTYGFIDDINEMLQLVGLNYGTFREFIYELVNEGYVEWDNIVKTYSLTSKGDNFLYIQCLNKISLNDLKEVNEGPDSRRINKLYIPKNFQKRFE